MVMQQTIILGPHVDLHPGIHGSLQEDPPVDICYFKRGALHHFLLGRESVPRDQTPFVEPHLGEFTDFGPGPQVVHTARWPVIGRRAWLTDTDDFGYPFLLGRYALNPVFEGEDPWSAELVESARSRASNMLQAYNHASCKAVLFRTRHALADAERWLVRLGLEHQSGPFLAKSRVIYPAQRALPDALFDAKWTPLRPLQVLFVGRDYEVKNGHLALQVMARLARRFSRCRFVYVGTVPEGLASTPSNLELHDGLARAAVLRLFRTSHVLFHPALSESFGMVFLEAAANGLAVVAAKGRGLAHLAEILGAEQAQLVDRDQVPPEAEEAHFEILLSELLEDPASARRLARANHQQASTGRFSLRQRNRQLGELYTAAAEEPAASGFELAMLPQFGERQVLELDSGRLIANRERFFAEHDIDRQAFNVSIDSSVFSVPPAPSNAEGADLSTNQGVTV